MISGLIRSCLTLAVLLFAWHSPLADVSEPLNVSGNARIIDGDTIEIGEQVIRLYGIDAPETGQTCQNSKGRKYNCGSDAANALKAIINGTVYCLGKEYDDYNRLIARCRTRDQTDIAEALINTGYAVAFRKFSSEYVSQERIARQNKQGLWSGTFDMPWAFRALRWQNASQQSPKTDCPIKGNINRQGEKIYHAPWSRSYARTRVDTSRSERWFCSEAEALAAGWRAPRR